MTRVRLGSVSYLNARPCVVGLEGHPRFDLRFDVPSRCSSLLHDGAIDVGLIPSIEYSAGAHPVPALPNRSRHRHSLFRASGISGGLYEAADGRGSVDRHGHELADVGSVDASALCKSVPDSIRPSSRAARTCRGCSRAAMRPCSLATAPFCPKGGRTSKKSISASSGPT